MAQRTTVLRLLQYSNNINSLNKDLQPSCRVLAKIIIMLINPYAASLTAHDPQPSEVPSSPLKTHFLLTRQILIQRASILLPSTQVQHNGQLRVRPNLPSTAITKSIHQGSICTNKSKIQKMVGIIMFCHLATQQPVQVQ